MQSDVVGEDMYGIKAGNAEIYSVKILKNFSYLQENYCILKHITESYFLWHYMSIWDMFFLKGGTNK